MDKKKLLIGSAIAVSIIALSVAVAFGMGKKDKGKDKVPVKKPKPKDKKQDNVIDDKFLFDLFDSYYEEDYFNVPPSDCTCAFGVPYVDSFGDCQCKDEAPFEQQEF